MEPERRHQSRKEPEKLTYVHFGPENGGIVLNASEGGIAFFAIAPLHQTGPIRLAIVPRDNAPRKPPAGLTVLAVSRVAEALQAAFTASA